MQETNQKKWLTQLLQRVPDTVTLGLIVLSGSLLAQLTWLLFPAKPNAPTVTLAENNPATSQVQEKQRTNVGDEVARQHLFGQVQLASLKTPKPTKPAPVKQAAKPNIPMTLLGVYNLSGNDAMAILEVRGEQKVFAVNEPIKLKTKSDQLIETGAVLVEVGDTHAVILHPNKQRETLRLGRKEINSLADLGRTQGQAAPKQATPPTPQAVSNSNVAAAPLAPKMANTESQPEASLNTANEPVDLNEVRNQLAENPMSIQDFIRPSPAIKNGKVIGYRVNPSKNKAAFRATGLSSGDIVTKVNGISITSPEAMQALNQLKSATSLQITVLRYGREQTIPINF